MVTELFLDQLISTERRAVRLYLIFAGGLILLGLLVMVLVPALIQTLVPDVISKMVGIGGGFVSSLSALQIKELLARRQKADMLVSLKSVKLSSTSQDENTNKRIEELVWKIVEKTALQ